MSHVAMFSHRIVTKQKFNYLGSSSVQRAVESIVLALL